MSIADLLRQKSKLEAKISEASGLSDIVAMMNYQSRLEIISEKLKAQIEQQAARVKELEAQLAAQRKGGDA